MKIKTFIFILQLFLCSGIEFYPLVINRYSDEVVLSSKTEKVFGFTLDISQFKNNEKIYIKISFDDFEGRRNSLNYYCFFSDNISGRDQLDLMDATKIYKKDHEDTFGSRIRYYFEIEKKEGASYLHFIIESSDTFNYDIGFTNTESDETKSNITIVIVAVVIFVSLFLLMVGVGIYGCCVMGKKQRARRMAAALYANQQQIDNMYYQQPINGQPQGSQPQQDQMIVYSQGTNPQENSPNQIETPNQGIKNNNQNNDGGTKDV